MIEVGFAGGPGFDEGGDEEEADVAAAPGRPDRPGRRGCSGGAGGRLGKAGLMQQLLVSGASTSWGAWDEVIAITPPSL